MEKYKYIVVEGNIGTGKTTLAKKISENYNRKLILEEFAENTFLPQFYRQPERYAFPLELSFLAERYKQLTANLVEQPGQMFVSDYLFEKSLLFAEVNLNPEEFKLYHQFYSRLTKDIPKPDLVIYLDKSLEQLQQNIVKRGRTFEKDISNTYLKKIHEGYETMLKNAGMNVLRIESENLDFVKNELHFEKVINKILTY